MPSIKLKYVKQQVRERRRKDGTYWRRLYYYYRRPGAPDDEKPLPGDPSQPCFHACLEQFNLRAERIDPAQIPGSFSHLVVLYREAPDFTSLAEKTRYDYGRILARLVKALGVFNAESITRRAIYAIRDGLQATPGEANSTLRVVALLYSWALDQEHVAKNPAIKLRLLKGNGPRQDLWSRQEEKRFLAVADRVIAEPFRFQIVTAQRLSDMCAARWTNYKAGVIKVWQRKTKKWVWVPAPEKLRNLLDSMERRSPFIFVDETDRPWTKDNFSRRFAETCRQAGLTGLQNHDLRRTAIVRLGEAGATLQGIVAISGHEIDYCSRILETYLPRTFKMAQEAVRLLDAEERRLDSLGAQTDEDRIAEIVASGVLDDNPSDGEGDEVPKRARRSAKPKEPAPGKELGTPQRRRQAARASQPPESRLANLGESGSNT